MKAMPLSAMPEARGAGRCSRTWGARLVRALVLVVLTIQNCSLMMVTSYSRALPGPKYLTSTAVLAGELLKTAVVLCVLVSLHGLRGAQAVIKHDVFSAKSRTMRYAVPSIFYTLQNNLWYYAMSNLDSVSAAVASQVKILSTAVFSTILLSRVLNNVHWSALGLLMTGLIVMKVGPEAHDTSGGDYFLGLAAMVAACTSSGYAGVYLEKLFKQQNVNVWTSNMQLQFFCLPIAALSTLSDMQGLRDGGLFVGWSGVTCAVVLLNALGGFLVSLTMKYADNILKTFAVSISLVMNCLLSSAFESVHLTPQVVAGVALVIIATLMYSMAGSRGSAGNAGRVSSEGAKAGYMPVDRAPDPEEGGSTSQEDERSGNDEFSPTNAQPLKIIGRVTSGQ